MDKASPGEISEQAGSSDCAKEMINQPKVKKKLSLLTSSSFAVYKKPTNLYHNLINTICVGHKWKRKDQCIANCDVETFYPKWEKSSFPSNEILSKLEVAVKNLDKKGGEAQQKQITCFFERIKTNKKPTDPNSDVREDLAVEEI